MSAESLDDPLAMLAEELRVARAELAEVRAAQEKWGEREARLKSSRDRAQRAADVISQALAERLRVEAIAAPRGRSLLGRALGGPTPEELRLAELIRASPLFDAAWYLRRYLDVVRSGDEPALHFLRNPTHPMRQPGPAFDTGQYIADHPEVLRDGVNPLVHFLQSPSSVGADSYPPEP